MLKNNCTSVQIKTAVGTKMMQMFKHKSKTTNDKKIDINIREEFKSCVHVNFFFFVF